MATTYTFDGNDLDAEAVVNLYEIDRATFSLVGQTEKANGGREALYLRTDGNPAFPVTIRQGFYPKNGDQGGEVSLSTRMNFWVHKLEDGVVVASKPASFVLSSNMPFGAVPDVNLYWTMLSNLFTWLLPVVEETDTFSNVEIQKLRFGVVNDMLAE